jgi:hypothetical protein
MGLAFKRPEVALDRYPYDWRMKRFMPYNANLFFIMGQKLKQPDAKGRTWWDKPYHISEYETIFDMAQDIEDSYISMNWFYKCSRRGEFVAVFDHICIDLDCYKYETNPTIQYHDLGENYEILLKFCDDNNIPRPSNILSSGRGIYLHYTFECPVPARCKGRFQATHRELLRKFIPWGADQATYDFSRVFRLPGSVNSQHPRRHRCEFLDYRGKFYDFSTLCDMVLPKKYEDYKKQKIARQERREKARVEYLARRKTNELVPDERGAQGFKGWASWAKKGLYDLKTLGFLRYRGPVRKGECDIFCHEAGILLAQISNPDNLPSNLEQWAEGVINEGYIAKHMHNSMQTLYKKAGQDYSAKKRHKGYTTGTKTIIQKLGITREEMKHLSVLIDHEERLFRKRTKRHEQGNVERPTSQGQSREAWLADNNLSVSKPWEALNISRATYYRMKKSGVL